MLLLRTGIVKVLFYKTICFFKDYPNGSCRPSARSLTEQQRILLDDWPHCAMFRTLSSEPLAKRKLISSYFFSLLFLSICLFYNFETNFHCVALAHSSYRQGWPQICNSPSAPHHCIRSADHSHLLPTSSFLCALKNNSISFCLCMWGLGRFHVCAV